MNSAARQAILAKVRASQRPPMVRAPYPDFKESAVVTLPREADAWSAFVERLRAVHGQAFTDVAALADFLRTGGWTHGYCDPALRAAVGEKLGAEFVIAYDFEVARVDDYQFGITRAAGAIAESGTIVINDATTSVRLAALAPWVHVAVLHPRDLWRDIPSALMRLGDDPNTIWITGPSKTGDIEGVLVEGVHGPGVQVCLRL